MTQSSRKHHMEAHKGVRRVGVANWQRSLTIPPGSRYLLQLDRRPRPCEGGPVPSLGALPSIAWLPPPPAALSPRPVLPSAPLPIALSFSSGRGNRPLLGRAPRDIKVLPTFSLGGPLFSSATRNNPPHASLSPGQARAGPTQRASLLPPAPSPEGVGPLPVCQF